MDGRGYGSGYSSWGGGGGGGGAGGNPGPANYDMYGGGYQDSMAGIGGYGGGAGGGQMKRGMSGGPMLPSSGGTHADVVIAKINQRLDMLTQMEGGMKGARADRFDQYESFDSRASGLSSSRDLYRSGGSNYGYGDGRGDSMLGQRGGSGFGGGMPLGGGRDFDSPSPSYGVAKMRPNMRDSFSGAQGGGPGGPGGGGWTGRRSPRRGGSTGGRGAAGGFGSRRPEPPPMGGGMQGGGGVGQPHRGYSPGGGRGKLPSLLSNRMYPETGGFQSSAPHDFPGRHFGGGPRAGRQRGRKRPLNKGKSKEAQKKRKQGPTTGDEPESKMNKTESDGAEATGEQPEENGGEKTENFTEDTFPPEEDDNVAPKQEEEKKQKPTPGSGQERHAKARRKRGFMDRLKFACSVCKFRSFYKEEMEVHLESRFHKDHFKFLCSQLSKPTTDFLEDYLKNKYKKTEERIGMLENHSAAICQMYKEQDLTRDLGMEHFLKKVEAAHCGACDLFIPMQLHLIQKHIKSHDHNYNRKGMMEQSKRGSLSVARSILNHKLIGKKLESYLKGENPFIGNDQDQEADEMMDEAGADGAVATTDGQADTTAVNNETAPEGEPVSEKAEEVEETTKTTEEVEKMEDELFGNEEEGFEVGEEEGFEVGEEEEGFVGHDVFGQAALRGVQEEGEEIPDVDETENNE